MRDDEARSMAPTSAQEVSSSVSAQMREPMRPEAPNTMMDVDEWVMTCIPGTRECMVRKLCSRGGVPSSDTLLSEFRALDQIGAPEPLESPMAPYEDSGEFPMAKKTKKKASKKGKKKASKKK